MESTTELPPRPAPRAGAKGLLRPSPATAQSWQTLVGHPIRCEFAIIFFALLSIPFTVLAALNFHYSLAGGLISTAFTLLASSISLYLYTRSHLSPATSLIRTLIFLIGWLITSAAVRYSTDYSDIINTDPDSDSFGDINETYAGKLWMIWVRSLVYWALSATFFVYMIIAAVAVHRERQMKKRQVYGMQGGGMPAPAYVGGGYPPQGPPGGYAPPPGPPPQRFA